MPPIPAHPQSSVVVRMNTKLLRALRHLSGDSLGPPPEVTHQVLPAKNILVVLMLHQHMVAHELLVVELMTLKRVLVRNGRAVGS